MQPDSVPIDLATALISAGGLGGDMQILIGDLPGWVSERVPPPENATVLGSAFVGSSVVGILRVPDAPEAAITRFKEELLKHGWKAPPPPPIYGRWRLPAGEVGEFQYNRDELDAAHALWRSADSYSDRRSPPKHRDERDGSGVDHWQVFHLQSATAT